MKESVRGWNATALKAARTAAGLTQEDLAAIMGITATPIVLWESGKGAPSPANALAAAQALDVEVHDLVDIRPAEALLRDLRTWAGLTQTMAAADLGIHNLGPIERGTRPLPQSLRQPMAKLYHVTSSAVAAAAEQTRQAWLDRIGSR